MEPVCYIHNDSLTFFCPTCKELHCVTTPCGTNKDIYAPTVYGASNIFTDYDYIKALKHPDQYNEYTYCHFAIINGMIFHHGDSHKNGIRVGFKVYRLPPINRPYEEEPVLIASDITCNAITNTMTEASMIERLEIVLKRRQEYPL